MNKTHTIKCPFCDYYIFLSPEIFRRFPLQEGTRIHCSNCALDFAFNSKYDKVIEQIIKF